MNPYTGHLVDIQGMKPEKLVELQRLGYEPIPDELSMAARKKLAGKREAHVSLTSSGKLSNWAKDKRKKKHKRKIAQASKKRNRI